MIRTRTLAAAAVFVCAGSLGAGAALFDANMLGSFQAAGLSFVESGVDKYVAKLPQNEVEDKQSRIEALRKKLSGKDIEPEPEVVSAVGTSTEEAPAEDDVVAAEMRCAGYSAYNKGWDSRGVKLMEAEGARLVYKDQNVGSTSLPTKLVLAELPLRSKPSGNKNCISSDVIGVTVAGALIKNNDAALYLGYGEGMLIGYTLDGFPLYGSSAQKTDGCGGAMAGGQYKYFLKSDRDTVLNCFASTPTSL